MTNCFNLKLTGAAVALALAGIAGSAAAATPGYVSSSSGQVWTSPYGMCWRTTDWTPEKAAAPCDVVPVAQVAPPPVAVAPPPPVAAAPTPPPPPVIEQISLSNDVLFEFDKAQLKPDGMKTLDEISNRLKGANVAAISLVGHADRIVLYDRSPLHSSARVWWLLNLFGASKIALLDGGLAAWAEAGQPVMVGAAGATETPGLFVAHADLARVRSLREVHSHVEAGDAQIVDARSPGRFAGAEPEPRPGVEPGHIPGALNLPYNRMFEGDGRWKSAHAIAAEFAAAGADPAKPMVATCGSGITACVLAFAAERIGGLMPVYDGSWTEWGSDPSTPKAKDA